MLNYTMSVLRGKGKGHGIESNRLSPQPSTAQREREKERLASLSLLHFLSPSRFCHLELTHFVI